MCIAAIKNMTGAMRARDTLRRVGIDSEVVSVDASLTKRGCAYGISFPCEREAEVKRILRNKKIDFGEIMGSFGNRSGF